MLAQEKSRCSEAVESLTAARSKEAELQSKLQTAQQALKDQEAAMAAEGDEKSRRLQASLAELQRTHEDCESCQGQI